MFVYFFLFVLGLLVGSFINVITLRYEPEQNLLSRKIIGGRSRCPNCLKKLSWYELIPLVSFFVQKGKCRSCGIGLSWQYPMVEVITGLVFFAIPWSLNNPLIINNLHNYQFLVSLIWILIFSLFVILFIIDLRHSIIPNQVNLSLGVLGLLLTAINGYYNKFGLLNGSFMGPYAAIFDLRDNIWINHLFAAFCGLFVFGALIFISRGRAMGWGDFKLIIVLGLIFGWPDILMIMFLSFLIGAAVSLVFLIRKKKTMKDAIPFGPFLVIGSALTFFLGYQIIQGYFSLFGL